MSDSKTNKQTNERRLTIRLNEEMDEAIDFLTTIANARGYFAVTRSTIIRTALAAGLIHVGDQLLGESKQ